MDWDRSRPSTALKYVGLTAARRPFPGGPVNQLRVLTHGAGSGPGCRRDKSSLKRWTTFSCQGNGAMTRASRRHTQAQTERQPEWQHAAPSSRPTSGGWRRLLVLLALGAILVVRRGLVPAACGVNPCAAYPAGGNGRTAARGRQRDSREDKRRSPSIPTRPARGASTDWCFSRTVFARKRGIVLRKPRHWNRRTTGGRTTWE